MHRLRIGIAQVNTTVGDFAGNADKILKVIEESRSSGVDLLTFPELAICGYPPEDLLFKPQFITENLRTLEKVIKASPGITVITGFVDSSDDIFNAAAIIHDGDLAGVYHKIFLPNYGVFDEDRYFRAGTECSVWQIGDIKFGVNICEDIWYEAGPATTQAYSGAEIIINISASPYHFGRGSIRERMISTRAADNVAVFVYNNLVGGQDELVFDGNSLIVDETGRPVAKGKQFEEDLIIADISAQDCMIPGGGKNYCFMKNRDGVRQRKLLLPGIHTAQINRMYLRDILNVWKTMQKCIMPSYSVLAITFVKTDSKKCLSGFREGSIQA